MQEVWKPVNGWEGLYEVSNLGRVRSLHYKKPYIMHPIVDNYGYVRISLVKPNSKKYKRCGVHRLVAEAFISNPDNLPQINHKDENKQNNNVNNLEWCTNKYNCNYRNHCKNVSASRLGMKFSELHLKNLRNSHAKVQGKRVGQYDTTGKLLNVFDSLSDAGRCFKTSAQNISHCCNGITNSAVGYIWRFVE